MGYRPEYANRRTLTARAVDLFKRRTKGLPTTAIAEKLGVDARTAYTALSRLEAAGVLLCDRGAKTNVWMRA